MEASGTSEEIEEGEDSDLGPVIKLKQKPVDNEPAWVKWVSQTLVYVAVLGLGFASGYMFLQWRWGPLLAEYQQALPALAVCDQIVRHPVEACGEILHMSPPLGVPSSTQNPGPVSSPPPGGKQEKASPGKADNGKH